MSRNLFFLDITVATIILAGIFSSTAESGQLTSETPAEPNKVFELLVIDEAAKTPCPEVKLSIRIIQSPSIEIKKEDVTDENGRCIIDLGGKKLDYVRIEARKEGFVPMRIAWSLSEPYTEIPDKYTLALEPGTKIGGIVQNEQGEPIEGASLFLIMPGGGGIEGVAIWDHEVKTDSNGHWLCDIIPAEFNNILIRLSHPDYIDDEMYGMTSVPPVEKLRDMTGVIVMKKGVTVGGRVLDMDGRPIEGATVAQGRDRHGSHFPDTRTDVDGNFIFMNARPGEMILTVQASGYSPDLKQIVVSEDIKPVEFRLEPGHTIRGRIIDAAGNPVAGAFVASDTWRGYRSLIWRVDTDAEGRFEWNEAPADEVLIDMGKRKYMSVRSYGMSASDEEHVVTMPPELKISGKVVDAETGEPIAEFKLLTGIDWANGRPVSWDRRREKTFTQGCYEVVFSYPYPMHLIKIEAEGYKPGISRQFDNNEGEIVFDFELEKGKGPTGIVQLPGGGPAEGAEVILCTPSQRVYLSNGRNRREGDSQFVETNQDGEFSFPAQTEPYQIVVLHDDGYAQMTDDELTNSSDVTLLPWATVCGKLMIGNEPGVNEDIRLIFDRSNEQNGLEIYQEYRTVTDSNGSFVFERVCPGNARVFREIKIGDNSTRFSHGVRVEIKPGQKHNVSIGGTGRPVTGKIIIPDYIKDKFNWQYSDYSMRINSPNSYTQFGFRIETDGSFRVDDVPSGDYTLDFNAYGPPPDDRTYRGERIGLLSRSFNVPEIPGGRSDEPLELGNLELQIINQSEFTPSLINKTCPALEDFDIDQSRLGSENKVMLICFFDMNQRPSRRCVMQITEQSEKLKQKNIVVIIVQASKVDKNSLDEWLKENDITFATGMIQDKAEQTRFNWGVKSLPWLILTDKKHTVIAEGFSLDELDAKIEKVGDKL